MKVLLAGSSGFCYGVQRAVSICQAAASEHNDCVTLGPIIHNESVIRDLEEKGVRTANALSEITRENTVIIRSHGAGKDELDYLAELGVNVIDATCPDVKKIHDIVLEELNAGRLPVIIGERRHPEVAAIASRCVRSETFETEEELANWLDSGDNAQKPVSVVFQTTNSRTVFSACADIIKKECTNHKIFDTICGATCRRQQEAAELSKNSDVMIVVGGLGSANSLKLADICRENCSRVYFIQSAQDLDKADIGLSDTVGIISGASTPAWIIKEVTQKMSEEIMVDGENIPTETEDTSIDTASDVTETAPVAPEAVSPEEPEASALSEQAEETAQDSVEPEDTGAAQQEPGEPSEADGSPDEQAATEETPAETDQAEDLFSPQPEITAMPEIVEEAPAAEIPESDGAGEEQPELAVSGTDDESMEEISGGTESFEEMLEKSIKTLHTGQKVSGIVTSITATEVSVDLGTKQSGYIPISEFADDANTDINDIIKIGDSIETFVMRVNDVEGMVMLSKKRLDAIKNWDVIEAAKEDRTIVEGVVTEENKGGIVVNVKGVRVFVPASQTGLPKSSPMTELVRKTVKLRVTEVNQSRRRVVGSIRAVQADERREKSEVLWNEIETGKQYDGVVKSMTSYGVFVDIGGVDGMIHISELSWTRIKQPSEVMAVGDEVSVYVLSFDKETRKISLGYKKSEDNPWTKFTTQNNVGDVVNVKVVKLMPFGAFAEINPGVDGLIHISQITDHRIGLPSEVLSDGQLVDVKITEIDNDRKKVSLSIRALIDPSSRELTDTEAAEVAADNTPVIVYDTDAPPPVDSEDDEEPVASEAQEDTAAEPAEEVSEETPAPQEPDEAADPDEAAETQAAQEPESNEDPEEADSSEPADGTD